MQLAGQSYAFYGDAIFSGPIEERAALKPEALPDEDKPAFWEYTGATSKHPFYLKCAYQDTAHYLVLNLHGAQRCTYTRADARTKCE